MTKPPPDQTETKRMAGAASENTTCGLTARAGNCMQTAADILSCHTVYDRVLSGSNADRA